MMKAAIGSLTFVLILDTKNSDLIAGMENSDWIAAMKHSDLIAGMENSDWIAAMKHSDWIADIC